MKSILITGAEGFVGSSFYTLLRNEGFNVFGTFLPELAVKQKNYFACDLLDFDSLHSLLKKIKPDVVYHLAAISSVGFSIREPQITFRTNIIGTANVLEAAHKVCPDAQILFISSCEVYGAGGKSIDEDSPIMLLSPYAVSKYAAELIVRQYCDVYGLKTAILRPFNHTGPGQREDFILASVARQITEIELGRRPPVITVGNISVIRQFMDVRDVIRAYRLAMDCMKPGDILNVAAGHGHSIEEALQILKRKAKAAFEVKIDESRFRAHDIMSLVGTGERFEKLTGFKPQFTFEKTLEDLLNYWRKTVG